MCKNTYVVMWRLYIYAIEFFYQRRSGVFTIYNGNAECYVRREGGKRRTVCRGRRAPRVGLTDHHSIGRAGAQRAPLRVSILTSPASTAAFAARRTAQQPTSPGGKSWRGGAERQRRFITGLKTGGRFQDTFIRARATAAALGVPRLDEHQSTKAASRPGVLRGERIRAVPPCGG